ncbi:hypothetical protein L3V86_09420 [Thiotrichales bacterium 19S11-10]|nr:hypothetical protein [Thiotrichales bacterium 19S11-10]
MVKSILSKVTYFENKNNPNILSKAFFVIFSDRLESRSKSKCSISTSEFRQNNSDQIINITQFLKRICL